MAIEKEQQRFIKFTVAAPAVFAFHLAHRPESEDGWLNVPLGDDESDCLQPRVCQTQSMNPKSASDVANKAVKIMSAQTPSEGFLVPTRPL